MICPVNSILIRTILKRINDPIITWGLVISSAVDLEPKNKYIDHSWMMDSAMISVLI